MNSFLTITAFLVVWFLISRYLLPKFGIST